MIPQKTLIQTINAFFDKLDNVNKQCENGSKTAPLEWYKMVQAWNKLDNVVEMHLLPFTQKEGGENAS